ncbi:small nuclear ribonucleoprotein E [Rhizophagus clarus]|uniref:Small nuclear ribonucleoprotein E n=1 Tax=Rhizophagus clarus TaxID=94130 RepID=A0A8H3LGX6_9GLOM|nr:small nuclear ribonucleoprotein E [Rhizophagus clarus]
MATKVQKIMVQPINLIFKYLQNKTKVQIWLYEQVDLRIEGQIIGFDEFMNLVLDNAEEVNLKKKTRNLLGRILLKGDNITLIQSKQVYSEENKAKRFKRFGFNNLHGLRIKIDSGDWIPQKVSPMNIWTGCLPDLRLGRFSL